MLIDRLPGSFPGRCLASAYDDLVFCVATSTDIQAGIADQARLALEALDSNLMRLGAGKSTLLSVCVMLRTMADKSVFDDIWGRWIGDDPQYWPQRSCVGVELGGSLLVEITAVALRQRGQQ
ncbi:hypothetical protein D9M70_424040 [compost metagenome]